MYDRRDKICVAEEIKYITERIKCVGKEIKYM